MTDSIASLNHRIIFVFCVHCSKPIGQMSMEDIGLQCREICVPCYEELTRNQPKG